MTDRIMISNVDVSGCEFIVDCLPLEDCTLMNCFCYENTNCYYKQLKRKEEECEKWKSYYDLCRQNQTLLKKIQGRINSHPKYGIEFTETGIIDKDERLSCLETDEQIKLIFTEYEEQLQAEKEKVEELKNRLAVANFEIENLRECRAPSMECLNRYTQALDEIKELAKETVRCKTLGCNCKNPEKCLSDTLEQILQECEVMNDV